MCSFTMCIFKLISFLKVNQHAQHSNGSFWFVLFFNVNLQTYFVFESKLTYTTFIWLHHEVHAHLFCEYSSWPTTWTWKILSLKFLKSLNHLVFICNFAESHRWPTTGTWKILSLKFLKSLNHLVFICNFAESHRWPITWTWKA